MATGSYSLELLARELVDAPAKSCTKQRKALKAFLAELDADREEHAGTISTAREQANDELEIDDWPFLSPADEGCWVSAWVWVPDE